MTIAMGSDHAGFELKEIIKEYLIGKGYIIHDLGTNSTVSVDYPDYAVPVCKEIQNDIASYGILVCYTGIGMSIAANKMNGIRAALVFNKDSAKLTREHNDANIICLAAKDINYEQAKVLVDIFLENDYLGNNETEIRHFRRVQKINDIENENK